MSNYINGCGSPIFRIYNSSNVLIDTINLPLTDSQGLIESIEEYSTLHQLLDFSFTKSIQGYKITFTLNYSEYTEKATTTDLMSLLTYEKAGYIIKLQPRSDIGARYFEVIGMNDKIDIGILKNGINSIGNKGITLTYMTKNLVSDIMVVDPDDVVIPIEETIII